MILEARSDGAGQEITRVLLPISGLFLILLLLILLTRVGCLNLISVVALV